MTYTTHVRSWWLCNSDLTMNETTKAIEIADEGAGEFVEIKQPFAIDLESNTIAIDPDEWPALRAALDEAFDQISTREAKL